MLLLLDKNHHNLYLKTRHGNGEECDELYLPCPHTLLSYIYPLFCSNPVGMRNRISSPSPTGSGIPALSSSPQWIIFLNKSFFQPWLQCCDALSSKDMMEIDLYGDGEERGRECEIWKKKRENYDKWMSSERPRL